ncbi:hypothetical protein MKW98_028533 [Papaver atlanticum]|uniref:Uncharacterized protein n=1 Tax=Papaver atlanticum TaxID=357466 RepID=A0AAD4XUE3_9MAGN|nr:hypothetical protein MKW98_028533 [Papaver atlanticum]
MDSLSSHPRRSPRLTDLARVRELTGTDTEKERRLRRAQYRAKQDSITEGERQERNERRRAAYRARISAANCQPDDRETSSSVQVCKSAREHKAESSCILRRSPRIQLQQRALQLEKNCIAMEERRSSTSESDKQQILEQQRRAYQMRRTTKGDATNNEHRPGLSSGKSFEQVQIKVCTFSAGFR